MKPLTLTILAMLLCSLALAQTPSPYEAPENAVAPTPLDELVLAGLRRKNIQPAAPCTDEIFIRRVYFDLIGTLPQAREVWDFLQDKTPDKRARLIDALMEREEFADYWAMKWCDLLRVKSEFPINLWPNAVQAYHVWIRQAVRDNKPYDQFARELLTSSGSNFRVGPANFYRAIQGREASAIASAVALTFMGTRLDAWPAAKKDDFARFFSRIAYKKTGEWKEEIVMMDPAVTEPLTSSFPDGQKVTIPASQDPREVFAEWLLAPDNYWFNKAIANRLWSWFLGRGVVHEPDDIRTGNPPSNPELLTYLEQELVKSKYDLRALFRLVLNSRTYQQSCTPRSKEKDAEALFAYYPVRRLEAEVILDALCYLAGDEQGYMSQIPEPFTYIPESHRAISLADGSITSGFLEMFGRPSRDTGLESERNNLPSDAQRLYLLNSSDIKSKIQGSALLQKLIEATKGDRKELIGWVYLTILSRYPTSEEAAVADKAFGTTGAAPKAAVEDLAWALVNSKEFLYRH